MNYVNSKIYLIDFPGGTVKNVHLTKVRRCPRPCPLLSVPVSISYDDIFDFASMSPVPALRSRIGSHRQVESEGQQDSMAGPLWQYVAALDVSREGFVPIALPAFSAE